MSELDIIDEYFDNRDFKVTGYVKNNKPVKFHPSELIDFPGAMGEHRFRQSGDKLEMLKRSIEKKGYNPDPIHVVVREDGKPFIYEGNHRLQEAFDSGRDFIEAKLTYIRGGERVDGPLHPERIGIKR